MAERGLTARQKKFASEYVICLNATQAAKNAGYAPDSAHVRGSELVRNSKVQAEMKRLFDSISMQPEEIIGRLAAQARGDFGDFIDGDTMTMSWEQAKELGITHLIKKIKQTTITSTDKDGDGKDTHIFEFELYDAQKALVHLGKTFAMFINRQELTGKDGASLMEGLVINIGNSDSE